MPIIKRLPPETVQAIRSGILAGRKAADLAGEIHVHKSSVARERARMVAEGALKPPVKPEPQRRRRAFGSDAALRKAVAMMQSAEDPKGLREAAEAFKAVSEIGARMDQRRAAGSVNWENLYRSRMAEVIEAVRRSDTIEEALQRIGAIFSGRDGEPC